MIRKTLVTLALTGGLVVTGAGAASAHECFVANRSVQGSTAAGHSSNWYTLHVAEFFRMFGLSGADLDEAVAMAGDAGIPETIAIFGKHTIPHNGEESATAPKSGDGKGIDHLSAYDDELVEILAHFGITLAV